MKYQKFATRAALEYIAALGTVCFGAWLLAGDDTSLDAHAFAHIRRVWGWFGFDPRVVLGAVSLTLGLIYAAAVYVNGRGMWWTPLARTACAGFNVVLYASFAYSIATVDVFSTGVSTYSYRAFLSLLLFGWGLDVAAYSVENAMRKAGRLWTRS